MIDPSKPWHPCCFVHEDGGEACHQPAEWEIWQTAGEPYSGLLACTEHVGFLLVDGKEHVVFPHIVQLRHRVVRSQVVYRSGGSTIVVTAACGKNTFDRESVTQYDSLVTCPECLKAMEESKK